MDIDSSGNNDNGMVMGNSSSPNSNGGVLGTGFWSTFPPQSLATSLYSNNTATNTMTTTPTGTGTTGPVAPVSAATNSANNNNMVCSVPFGLIVPGGPLRTDFVPADATNTKFTLTLSCPGDLPFPITSVNELVLVTLPSMTPSMMIPPNQGLLWFWQYQSDVATTGFEVLGSLTPTAPSFIARTGWSEHEQLINLSSATSNPNYVGKLVIGVSIESLDNIANQQIHKPTAIAANTNIAQKIGQDLFRFMQSFDAGTTGGHMVVPNNIFERWWKRFENRSRRDPNFFLKSSSDD